MALTPFLRLNKPPFDTIPWDEAVNGNMDIIDAFTSLYMSVPNFTGVWTNSTAYFVGQNALDTSVNLIYTCLVNHTSMDPPSTFAADRAAHFLYWQQTIPGAPVSVPVRNDVGRNKIHNGTFTVAQRGDGPFAASGFNYTLDRWELGVSADTASVTRETATDDDRLVIADEEVLYFMRNVFSGDSGSSSYNRIVQYLENINRFVGKQVTISFWARADSPKRIGIAVAGYAGSGGGGFNVPVGHSQLLTTGWVRYAYTLTIPSLLGVTKGTVQESWIVVMLYYSSGITEDAQNGNVGVQSGTIDLWGVQLELASTVSALDKPDAATVLINCQRFYQRHYGLLISGYAPASNGVVQDFTLPTTMRASPTVSVLNVSFSTNTAGPNYIDGNTTHIIFNTIATALGLASAGYDIEASADLTD